MALVMPAAPGFLPGRFGLETNTQRFTSPYTNATQRLLLSGARWAATYNLPAMSRAQMAEWQAFLLSLEGGANTFSGSDPDGKTARGTPTGTPLVKGAGQTGSTLLIDGCTPNVANWLRTGDYIAVNGELKMVTADCTTNGSGEVTVSFMPRLRNSPPDNAVVTVTNASCEMILVDDQQSMWNSARKLGFYEGLSFSAIEVFS